jgi:hypothetical protein
VGRDWKWALGEQKSDGCGLNKPGQCNRNEKKREIKGKGHKRKQNRLGLKIDQYKLTRREAQKLKNNYEQ